MKNINAYFTVLLFYSQKMVTLLYVYVYVGMVYKDRFVQIYS